MANDFFVKQYQEGQKRYCEGYKSQVTRDLFKIGTQHGEPPKGIGYGLSSNFINALEEIPYSSKNLIVVSWKAKADFDYESTAYDKSTFDADVVDYKISLEEFDAVVNDLQRSEYWIPQYTFPASLCGGMLVVPLILMAIWALVLGHGVDKSHPIMFLLIAVICPVLSLANLLSPYFVYKANLSRLENRETEFGKILDTWNERVFTDRKVKWKAGKYGCWLELHFEKDLRALESFNTELHEIALEDLQEEYQKEAKKAGVNVDGQMVGLGAEGCIRIGMGGGSRNGGSPDNSGYHENIDSSKIGHAFPAKNIETKKADSDDLEIQNVNLGRPLIANQH